MGSLYRIRKLRKPFVKSIALLFVCKKEHIRLRSQSAFVAVNFVLVRFWLARQVVHVMVDSKQHICFTFLDRE